MLSVYHLALGIAAVLALALSWKTPRAGLWIATLAASFVASVLYLYMPKPGWPAVWWPPHAGIATLCDAAVVVAIFRYGQERWETVVLRSVMMVSVTINLIQTSAYTLGFPPMLPHDLYAQILEGINYIALLLIGGVGIMDRINDRTAVPSRPRSALARLSDIAHETGWKTPPLAKW